MKRIARVLLAMAWLLPTFSWAETPLSAGQMWTYKTRPGEEASRVIILKVESYPGFGDIAHIRVEGLHLAGPEKGSTITELPHQPFHEDALRRSLVTLVRKNVKLPDFESGYAAWKEAFDAKRAGAFRISVADTVALSEEATRRFKEMPPERKAARKDITITVPIKGL